MNTGNRNWLDDICLASLHKMYDRIVICTGICWESGEITKVELYEPATDKVNQCTYKEIEDMVRSNKLVLHTPQTGRKVK
jgi:hypothetical protein